MKETDSGNPVHEGSHAITPYLIVREAVELLEFVKLVFGATGEVIGTGSQGGIHAEMKIGDSMVMIGGGPAWTDTPMPTALHYYVPDADAVYRRAVEAGATSIREPVNQPYGDREATVKDLAGNVWYIATHLAGPHIPEGLHSIQVYLHPHGTAELIDFLHRALGAELVDRNVAPDGTIAHARIRIGDSIVELGEAHGPWQPMPTVFFLRVSDTDALYRRALAAGAESLGEPADQSFGDRLAAIKDPGGNLWYIAAEIKKKAQ
jgi:PhnB protein